MLTFQDILIYIQMIESFLWSYCAVPAIVLLGLYLSFIHKFPQLTKSKHLITVFKHAFKTEEGPVNRGISPLRAFFSSLGGCIGIGNIVAVCTAVQIGGPGAVFWLWVAAFLGMIVKYSEVYLGIKYRVANLHGSFDGGPMFYIGKVYGNKIMPKIFSILLAMYGTEVYMFKVVSDSVAMTWNFESHSVSYLLIIAILIVSRGGVDKVGQICSATIPLFLTLFIGMSTWVLFHSPIPFLNVLKTIIHSAFNGHAAIGGFAGSTVALTIGQGMARACYSSDIGSGYASVVQSETSQYYPENQAIFEFFGIFVDTFVVSTLTTFVIISTNLWFESIPASHLLQTAFSQYFNGMDYFIPFFISLLGFSNLLAFFSVGKKCVNYLQPRWGGWAYYGYASIMYLIFTHTSQRYALLLMSMIGVSLLLINLYAILKLNKELVLPDLKKNYFQKK